MHEYKLSYGDKLLAYTHFRMLNINNFQIHGDGGNVNTVCTPYSVFRIPDFRQLVGIVFCEWKDWTKQPKCRNYHRQQDHPECLPSSSDRQMCKSERQNCRTIVCVLNRLSEGLHDRKRESARFSLLNLNFFDFNLRFVLKRVSEFSPCVCSGKEYIHRGTEVVC